MTVKIRKINLKKTGPLKYPDSERCKNSFLFFK